MLGHKGIYFIVGALIGCEFENLLIHDATFILLTFYFEQSIDTAL